MNTLQKEDATLTPVGHQSAPPRRFSQRLHFVEPDSTLEVYVPKAKRDISMRPKKLLFGAISDPRLRVKLPIPVDISGKKGAVVTHWSDIGEFGYGPHMSAALDDFGKTVSELYWSLDSREGDLGDDLKKVLSILRHHFMPRPTAHESA